MTSRKSSKTEFIYGEEAGYLPIKSKVRKYLLRFGMRRNNPSAVEVNIRVSGVSAIVAQLKMISVEQFRNIYLRFSYALVPKVEAHIRRMRDGYGETTNMVISETSMIESEVLADNVTPVSR
jgi:hypothetical protein